MVYVRRIFAAVALEGSSINAIKVAFDREGVSTPAEAPYWLHKAMRDIIFDDCYKAHTFEEVRALVGDGAAVLSRLERGKRYGIWYFGRRKTQTRQVSERAADGNVLYRKKQLVEGNPKSEWVAVPIVDSTVPREWVDAPERP